MCRAANANAKTSRRVRAQQSFGFKPSTTVEGSSNFAELTMARWRGPRRSLLRPLGRANGHPPLDRIFDLNALDKTLARIVAWEHEDLSRWPFCGRIRREGVGI